MNNGRAWTRDFEEGILLSFHFAFIIEEARF
jgi:hypothetical protein